MLIGREPEQAILGRLVAGARVGESGCLVITGDPGIGKSALLEDVVEQAQGMNLLRASGTRAEREVGFGGLLQLFGPVLDHLDEIPAPRARALEVALALREGENQERFAVGAACLSLLSRYADERPLLVAIDDAQDLDRPTAEALAFAVRRLVADPIAVVLAGRPDAESPFRAAGLSELPLLGLGPEEAARLLAAVAPPPVTEELTRSVISLTGGNPLAVRELAGDLDRLARRSPLTPGPVPDRIAEAYGRRAGDLSRPARELLLLAVVAGGDLAVVERAARRRGLELAPMAEGERAGLVHLDGTRAMVQHPLVAAGVYAAAGAQDRRRAHLEVADALPVAEVERRAWHRAEGTIGHDDSVATDLAVVAERANRRGAHAVAATAWERAAELTGSNPARDERVLAAAEQAWLAGQQDRAARLLDELPSEGDVATDWLRGTIALRAGSLDRARLLLDRAADGAAEDDPARAVLILSDQVEASLFRADNRTGVRAADRIDALLGRAPQGGYDDRVRLRGRISSGIARVLAGQPGIGAIRSVVDELQSRTTWLDDSRHPGWMVIGALFLRETTTGRELIRHAVEEVRDRCALTTLPSLLFLTGRFEATSDRWQDGVTAYQEGIAMARETGQSTDLAMLLAALAGLLARRGEEQACRAAAEEAVALAREHGVHMAAVWATSALGDLEHGLGRTDRSGERYRELEQLMDVRGLHDVDLSPAPEIVECLVRQGEMGEAALRARAFLARAEAKGQPWALARAHRAMAAVASPEEALAHYERALALHAQTPDLFERARSQLALGAALRRMRRRVAARTPLQAALEAFDRLGAGQWAEQAAGEAEATGATVLRTGATGLARLTPQEGQIARLLGTGRTTKEAAAALFLSPKTVEYHLRHVYQKLGIASRSELARVVAEDA
ncbi:helix-turn-helix transcriptional regulator [Nocardioides insulae]|uniref:helix-turn-helix transcriptional regulator n=1 Tax=Nocardioides insulae TaxID=394734 RepID=UPI000409D387|nr:LuxR family transcriptional regulator [Nocardioides insulae]